MKEIYVKNKGKTHTIDQYLNQKTGLVPSKFSISLLLRECHQPQMY